VPCACARSFEQSVARPADRHIGPTARAAAIAWVVAGTLTALDAAAYDRVASIGESPFSFVSDPQAAPSGVLVDIVHALDRATHSSTKIVMRPFARSLKETAAGLADFHFPLIQSEDTPAPEGLAYVMEVDFGKIYFVIYSRKTAPLDAQTVAAAANIEIEPGHEPFFPFPVTATHCLSCSLDKILLGRTDALIVAADIVDPLLHDPRYKGIHRALYKAFPVRALVPAKADSTATRHYLIEGVTHLKQTGELWAIRHQPAPYSDWQP
jgi:hypothetical protein